MVKNKNFIIVAIVAVVNALGYGIIIPILYSYSQRFGLSDFQNGLLFATFSVCQFVSTPVIGRLSDRYGRKPLLVLSLLGTVGSFLIMAVAPNAMFLFLARALDGITAGNIPVAAAVISDSTEVHERAKGFGIIGAAFGFGFVFGPAISALTTGFSPAMPFLIAAGVAMLAVIITLIFLPETNKHMGEIIEGKLFNLKKLAMSVVDPAIGETLLISFIFSLAFSMFIYAYQPFSVKIMYFSVQQISINFVIFGIIGFVAQMFIIPRTVKIFGEKKALVGATIVTTLAFAGLFFVRDYLAFVLVSILLALANGFAGPIIQALLSREVDARSQGSIMGLNSSYISLGMIIGPILGGVLATIAVPWPFLGGAAMASVCVVLAFKLLKKPLENKDLF